MATDSSISNTAFQEALQRARQLAAKISQPSSSSGLKRPNEEEEDDYRSDYKRASFDPIGSKLSEMKNQNKPQKGQLYLNGVVFNGEKTLDFMLPGNKVGFVIGKGGEMIRNLQDRAGVRMIIYQETNEASDRDKQLRITGPPDKVDYAKELVDELLIEKDMESAKMRNSGPPNRMSEYGSNSRMTFYEYPVSPQLIGLVIGKGGETIRKIQADSGCKVQFDTAKLDAQGNKICQFTGTQEAVNKAVELVKEIVDTITGGQGTIDEIRLIVPMSRTGSVIGRGGETIRSLKQQCGCNIELDKSFKTDNDEKCFILRGDPDKITYAQQLITDKVGGSVSVLSSTLPNNPNADSQYGGYNHAYSNQMGRSPSSTSSSSAQPHYWQQSASAADASKAVQEQYAMWNAYYAQYAQQYAQQPQASNENGAASSTQDQQASGEATFHQWIEYYKAYGMTKEAEMMEQKLKEYKKSKKTNEDGKSSFNENGKSE